MDQFQQLKTSGLNIQYYFVCKRKLWLHSHGIELEQESDRVLQGKVLHEGSYKRLSNKEVLIDNLIRLDMYGDYVGEVKSSSKMHEADDMQLKYYLYFLKQMGIEKTGRIHYPKEKRVDEIELTAKDEKKMGEILREVQQIVYSNKSPKATRLPYCIKCAYYSFCWVGEE